MNNNQKDEVVFLYLDDIIPNRFQPREVFDEKALKELAASIREHGVIQPIIVRNVNGKYEIIAGERRYKASALAGLTKIPAIIRNLDDKESSKVALLENLQRKNLSPIEEARTYQKILEIDQMTQEELAKTMGKSQSSVANKLRLLSLPDEVQDALLKEEISERHARTLLNIPDTKKQKEMLKKIINTKMSVKSLEEEIKEMYPKNNNKNTEENYINNDPIMPSMDLSLPSENIGKVTIAPPNEMDEPVFINYGEIDNEAEFYKDQPTQLNFDANVDKVDINQIKENANDIDSENSGNLDSLLNITNDSKMPINGDEYKFLTPAEGIVKESISENNEDNNDYFKVSETDNFDNFIPSNNQNLEEIYTIDSAKDKIKDLINLLTSKGIKISYDEMNFDKSYQIIIKIAKE